MRKKHYCYGEEKAPRKLHAFRVRAERNLWVAYGNGTRAKIPATRVYEEYSEEEQAAARSTLTDWRG